MLKIAGFILFLAIAALPLLGASPKESQVSLRGVVSSPSEERMEGVLVSARKPGGTISVTVVSGATGEYSFPRTKLAPGNYNLTIRATGYVLPPTQVVVSASSAAELNLELKPTDSLFPQLSNAELLASIPGTAAEKAKINNCVTCHSLSRILASRFNADEWYAKLQFMNTVAASGAKHPQRLQYAGQLPPFPPDEALQRYLASINLSAVEKWLYRFKPLPRPKGRGTRVIITEYDLPRRDSQPHDVLVDAKGMVWYSDFGFPFLGKLNPVTGEIKEYPHPVLKPGFPTGSNPVEIDSSGNLFLGTMSQGMLARFDPTTEKFTTWTPPPKDNLYAYVTMISAVAPNGTIWFANRTGLQQETLNRLDPRTGKIDTFDPYRRIQGETSGMDQQAGYGVPSAASARKHGMYGLATDSRGDGYFLDLSGGSVGRLRAATGEVTLFPTPTPNSGPRRGVIDKQDRFWFAEYYGNKIGMFDIKTEKITEWPLPGEYSRPYDAGIDSHGDIWTAGMHTDSIYRLHPASGEVTEYLLPTVQANIRKVSTGIGSSGKSVVLWLGENHQARIARIEPLD
ncbi:MAG TPA: carboxypeptidase regulatory-like domain-containing protein [Terriglobales bacterium]|nr:carboxypeptidase regulatory-like domain-containing protein [Terriglobales bacterium]